MLSYYLSAYLNYFVLAAHWLQNFASLTMKMPGFGWMYSILSMGLVEVVGLFFVGSLGLPKLDLLFYFFAATEVWVVLLNFLPVSVFNF